MFFVMLDTHEQLVYDILGLLQQLELITASSQRWDCVSNITEAKYYKDFSDRGTGVDWRDN